MKKLMISLCALCFAGAVNAQVSKAPLSEKAQRLSQMSVSHKIEKQESQTTKSRKADVDIDSTVTQAAYNWNGAITFNWLLLDGQDLKTNGFCNEDLILWVYGTGGFISMAGSGEIGYHFMTGPGTFYEDNYIYPNLGVPYAAATGLLRAPATSLLHNGEYDSMPFYFKLYDYTKVNEQSVLEGLSEFGPDGYVDVVYPTDPEKYTALSDTVWVPAGCEISNGKGYPLQFLAKAEFKDVESWKRLGEDFCLSMMFPIDWDEEGDTVIDVAWNVLPFIMIQENGDEIQSEFPHCTYIVYDFARTTGMWKNNRPDNHERYPNMVKDSIMQPNARYATLPMDSWYWEDGSNTVGEPWMKIYYTEWTALQSANKADRYVQLSPVPATDYVNFKSYTDMSRIEIYSLGGQLVKAVNVSGETYRMDLTGMNSGMYVARIYSEKGISSKKLIVR